MRNHPSLPVDAPQWLRDADIDDPVVTIEYGVVNWRGGVWRGGVWRGGYWHGGYWRGGYWHGGYWRGGEWLGGYWHDGEWHGGYWRGGEWLGGRSSPTRCKWLVLSYGDTIHIGCKAMTIEGWDAFFASDQEFDTARGTEDFRLIHRAYMAARAALMFDRENPKIE